MNREGRASQTQRLASGDPPMVSSDRLFDGRREIIIQHGEERYRLKVTASNKLILIK